MRRDPYESRVTALTKEMEEAHLDGFLLLSNADMLYFAGYPGGSGLLITRDGESFFYVSNVNYEQAKEEVMRSEVELLKRRDLEVRLKGKMEDLKMRRMAFKDLTADTYLKLSAVLKDIKIESRSDLVWKLRKVKDSNEIRTIRKASEITSIGLDRAIEVIKPGVREFQVAAEMEYIFRLNGAEGTAFETMVASGERSAFPHGGCSERRLRGGDIIMIDVGAKYGNYCVDVTRTFVLGKPSTEEERLFNAVKAAQDEAMKVLGEGVEAKEADLAARKLLDSQNLKDNFVHGLGHGLGLEIHEPPALNPESKDTLEKGNVVTVEPGAYITGFGGFRIEDTVLIAEGGLEKITNYPIEISI